jgi:hypothetical protein
VQVLPDCQRLCEPEYLLVIVTNRSTNSTCRYLDLDSVSQCILARKRKVKSTDQNIIVSDTRDIDLDHSELLSSRVSGHVRFAPGP